MIFLMGFMSADCIVSCLLVFFFLFIFFPLGSSVGVTREFETTSWFFSLLSAVAMGDVVHRAGFYKGYA